MEFYKLEKPRREVALEDAFNLILTCEGIHDFIRKVNSPEYLYWDKIKHQQRPDGITAEQFWAAVKFTRTLPYSRSNTPISNSDEKVFSWLMLPGWEHFLHKADMDLGGTIVSRYSYDPADRQRFVRSGLIEEAIASSQLEGATTTRKVAKEMLREKRTPANKSQWMIRNNYEAMVQIESNLRTEELSVSLLFDLHTTLCQHTMDESEIGRLRKNSDPIMVVDSTTDKVLHKPPPASRLNKELSRLVTYANDDSDDSKFVHPITKAIILHFWIGYLHPFTDGNGRLARAIFYWYVLRKGYWTFSFLPVSRVIKKSPAQYRDAYIYTEQDDSDLTYFIDYNIRKIAQAKTEFEKYLKRKLAENKLLTQATQSKYRLNSRQIRLLRYLYRNPDATTTIEVHCREYDITRPTARKDLELLQAAGFVSSNKVGKERPFKATEKAAELFT